MRHPAASLVVALLVVGAGGLAAARSYIDPSPERELAEGPDWLAYAKIDRDYEIGETAVIAFRELGGTVFDVETVTAVASLDRMLSDMPEVERVLSIASATALDRDGDVLDLNPLLPAGPITRETAMKLATRIRRHPVYGKALVDAHHETTFLFVQLSPDITDPIRRLEVVRDIREKGDAFRAKHRSVHFAGSPFTKEAIAAAMQRDALLFFPLVTLVLGILLWVSFGDPVAMLVPLTIVAPSAVLAVGLVGVIGAPLSLVTAMVPSVVLAAGLAAGTSFLSELRRQYARTEDRDGALLGTVEALTLPSLLAGSAAVAGFMALGRSELASIRELGYAAAVGCAAVHAITLFVVPPLLRVLAYPRRVHPAGLSAARMSRAVTRAAHALRRRGMVTMAAVGLLCGVCIAAITGLRVDSSDLAHLDPEHRLRQDVAVVDRTLGGADTLELILDGDRPGYFKDIAALGRLEQLGKKLETFPAIHTAFSVADYLEIANAVMTGDGQGELHLPGSPEAVAQLAAIDPAPFSAFTSADMAQARMALQVHALSSEEVLALGRAVEATATEVLAGAPVKATITGLPVLYARLVRRVVEGAAQSFGIAAAIVWVILILGLRSVGLGTAAILPTVLAALFTAGVVGITGAPADQGLVFTLALALVFASHHALRFATRYQRARAEGSPSRDSAALYALTSAGHPSAVSSLVLAICLGMCACSSFGPTHYAALFGLLFVAVATVLNLTLLPMMLMGAEALGPPRPAARPATFVHQVSTPPSTR